MRRGGDNHTCGRELQRAVEVALVRADPPLLASPVADIDRTPTGLLPLIGIADLWSVLFLRVRAKLGFLDRRLHAIAGRILHRSPNMLEGAPEQI